MMRRGKTLRFWKRSRTRATAPGSLSATIRRRHSDDSGRYMVNNPHTIRVRSKNHRRPAFSEGRAGNARAAEYEIAHVPVEYAPIAQKGGDQALVTACPHRPPC